MCSFEIGRLKEQPIQETKIERINFKEMVLDLEQILYSFLPSVNKSNNGGSILYASGMYTTIEHSLRYSLEENSLKANCTIGVNNSLDYLCLFLQLTSVNNTN